MRTQDDGVRGARGVCISIRKLDGEIELTIDDVRRRIPVYAASLVHRQGIPR